MAVVFGAKTVYNNSPNGNTITQTHSHIGGTDEAIIVQCYISATDVVSVTYGGVALTSVGLEGNATKVGYGWRWSCWVLNSGIIPTGANDVVVTLATTSWVKDGLWINSVTGFGSIDQVQNIGLTVNPKDLTFNVTTAGSVAMLGDSNGGAALTFFMPKAGLVPLTTELQIESSNSIYSANSGQLPVGTVVGTVAGNGGAVFQNEMFGLMINAAAATTTTSTRNRFWIVS